MRVLALEPYAAVSHRSFLEGLSRHSRHDVRVETLPARGWKWRMRTSALHFARELAHSEPWDVLLASDYLNLAELLALLPPGLRERPALVYFHENQLTYPLQGDERRDNHFAFVHLYALLAAERALFNSDYHRRTFFAALPELLSLVPDVDLRGTSSGLEAKSGVLPLGVETAAGRPSPPSEQPPVVLWNHRWEYDKAPEALLAGVRLLVQDGVDFHLLLLGERFRSTPAAFEELRDVLGPRLVDTGFLPAREDYLAALASADIVVSTARHEFFGLGTLEALRAGLLPVLPDDLAYPELLPPDLRGAPLLYDRAEGVAPALARALEAVRAGAWLDERRALVEWTDRFLWSELAPRYDAEFERLVAGA